MPARPRLPDGYDLPGEMNGWTHDPDSGMNAHVWADYGEHASVGVFSSVGKVYAKVFDERVNGFENSVRLFETDLEDDVQFTDGERQAVDDMIERAIAWMRETAPDEWSHPGVNEAVFETPTGYELHNYNRENRDTTIYYHLEDAPEAADRGVDPVDATPETFPYLVIHCWNGSGNSEISLAPWPRAHDHKMKEVVETPDECGLDVALTMARSYADEHFGDGADVASVSGQSDLERWSV